MTAVWTMRVAGRRERAGLARNAARRFATRTQGPGASPVQTLGKARRPGNVAPASSFAAAATKAHAVANPTLRLDTMNEHLRKMEYAVRGEVPIAAGKIQKELSQGSKKYPFDKVLLCNIGNPQAVGTPPITFYRQVLALVDSPSLLAPEHRENLSKLFTEAEIERAEELVANMPGGSGAYTDSQGTELVRKNVAQFIEDRDGYPCDPDNIFLTNGASSGIQMLLTALIADPSHAILTPVPQYPIYSALIALFNGQAEGYYLDESKQWALTTEELNRTYEDSVAKGNEPRAMVLINPGNPTGSVLSYDDLCNVVRFCYKNKLVLLADEVYQENIYTEDRPFISVKSVVEDLGLPIELASFHSTSKGFIGECGRRGGYMELCNFDEDVHAQIVKLASSGLCSNTDGQVMTDLMVRPPAPGPSRDAFFNERDAILGSMQKKALMMERFLNDIPGVSCQPLSGAMYAFPSIELPAEFVENARREGKAPDTAYALSLLRNTGICAVPGSGFNQVDGTFHLRLTILPDEESLENAMHRFREHHLELTKQN
ncbi:Alanine aminotransferase 1 [Hondaea fermentalgiana]|uniref:Alanine aminotransferase 1 n=1 Tax=Hondaea fermentalgiana TaxID=2315210 RepID=A0A2R5GPA0_9STRA|nr:Alanine aminotransferase 1 [Hondaea fermentalgiana]|eukprot:GBG32445.1 Alanine aminotransferase 1 [Hondaea fermentalgiana]